MLKTIILLKRLIFKWLEIGDSKIDKFSIGDDEKIVRKSKNLKSQNLFKSGNLKGKKLSKSQKSAKSEKKLAKNGNLSNFGATKTRSKFLILNTKTIFNCLQLSFIIASIL